MAGLSPLDRDLAIRTILGEASNQGDAGQAAVASVILNRVASGRWGDSARSVVLAKNQFEPWDTRKGELLSYSPQDAKYQRAGQIFDMVASGGIPDLTNGSTHFLNAATVRGRGTYGNPNGLPNWAQGQGQQIGAHTFFAPEGRVSWANMGGGKGAAAAAPPVMIGGGSGVGDTADPDAVFGELTKVLGKNAKPGGAGGQTPPAQAPKPPAMQPIVPQTAEDLSPDDVFKEITAGAARNVKATAASSTPADPVKPSQVAKTVSDAPGAARTAAGAFAAGAINGIPIVGPYALGGMERAAAAANAFKNGTAYDAELARAQALSKGLAADNPLTTTAGSVAGNVMALGPVGATAIGARALGLVGENLLTRAMAGGASGALIGAADAGVRAGGDPGAIVEGGKIGGILGAAAPGVAKVAGAAIEPAVRYVADAARGGVQGLGRAATNKLAQAVGADDAAAVQARLAELGPLGMLGEAGPTLQGATAGLVATPGEGKTILENAVRGRAAGANQRLNEDVRAAIGPAEDPVKVTSEILALRRAKDAPAYTKALGEAPPVDVSGLVSSIDKALQTAEGGQKTALQTLRARLVKSEGSPAVAGGPTGLVDEFGRPITSPGKPAKGPTLQTSAENLHNIKGELDAVINYGAPGLGVEQGAVARTQGALKAARGQLNDALEAQVPGYSDANRASAALAKRAEAVETGTKVLGSGQSTPTPEAVVEMLSAMSPGERIALAKGTRGEIERQLGVKINDLTALKSALQGEGGWNTAKLASIFGEKPTERLVGAVNREAAFAGTTNKLLNNSMTEKYRQGSEFLQQPPNWLMQQFEGVPQMGFPANVAVLANRLLAKPTYNALVRSDPAPMYADMARALTAQGGERDALVSALTQRAAGNAKADALAKFLASRASPSSNLLTNSAARAYDRR